MMVSKSVPAKTLAERHGSPERSPGRTVPEFPSERDL
jgi:hypothetical protein